MATHKEPLNGRKTGMAKLSISKAWEESIAFLGRESRLVTPVALAMFMVPGTLFGWYNPSGDPSKASGGLGWPFTLLVLALAVSGQMVIAGLAIGWRGSVGSALAQSMRRVWGVLAAVLIVFIPLTMLLVFAVAIMVGGAGITEPAQITAEALAAVPGLRMLLLVMTLIFLFAAVRLFPLSAVGMVETSNPLRLLSRCWRLTAGNFLRLLATLLLFLVAGLVASMAVTTVVGSAMTIIAGEPQPYNVSALIVALADATVSAAISAISAALVGRIYFQMTAADATVPEVNREAK
jgi:hypothetical protein